MYLVVLKSWKVLFATFLALVLLALLLPDFGLLERAEIFLSTLIVFFTITAGFTIATAWEEYTRMREAISNEIGKITITYALVKLFGNDVRKGFTDRLDRYLMSVIATPYEQFAKTNRFFNDVRDFLLESIKPRNEKESSLFDKTIDMLGDWEDARQVQIILGPSRIPKALWALLIILALGTVIYMYLIKVEGVISFTVTVLVSFSILLTLFVIKQLDEYTFGDVPLFTESTEQLFDMIGKPRFYWESYIKTGEVIPPEHAKNYRTKLPKDIEKEVELKWLF